MGVGEGLGEKEAGEKWGLEGSQITTQPLQRHSKIEIRYCIVQVTTTSE